MSENLDLRRITNPAFTRTTVDRFTRVSKTVEHPERHHPMCQDCKHGIERFRAVNSVNAHKFCKHECHSIEIPSQDVIATWPVYDAEPDPLTYWPGKMVEERNMETAGTGQIGTGKYH